MTETKTAPTDKARQSYIEEIVRHGMGTYGTVKSFRVTMNNNGDFVVEFKRGPGDRRSINPDAIETTLHMISGVAKVDIKTARWVITASVYIHRDPQASAVLTKLELFQALNAAGNEYAAPVNYNATEKKFYVCAAPGSNGDVWEYLPAIIAPSWFGRWNDDQRAALIDLANGETSPMGYDIDIFYAIATELGVSLDDPRVNKNDALNTDEAYCEYCSSCSVELETEADEYRGRYDTLLCKKCFEDDIEEADEDDAPFEGAEQCGDCQKWVEPLDIVDGKCDACILKDIRPATDDTKTTEKSGGEANDSYPCDRCGTPTNERFADEKYGEVCETCSDLGEPEPLTEPTISDESFDREKMLSRLEKLLALANGEGTTEAERNLAMERASSLMTKYRIDETMIRLATDDEAPMTHLYVPIGLFWEQKAWKLALVPAVARLCFCTGWMCKGNEYALFVGEQDAIAAAEVMINGLMAQLKAAYAHDAKTYEGAKDVDGMIWKKDYLVSASRRIAERVRHIENEREAAVTIAVQDKLGLRMNSTPAEAKRAVSLIVVDADQQKAATEYVADKFGFTTSRTSGTMIKSADAAALGRAAGDKATFTKGVSASSSKQINS